MAWLRRRTTRRAAFGFTLLFAPVLAALFWLGDQQDKQQTQEAAQYQQDCSKATATSPGCQLLTMQVYERKKEGFLDPDSDAHLWLGLVSRSGQRFKADTSGPQWHRLGVGDKVTALVWNGEVQEVSDSGGTERMETNPVWKVEGRRLSAVGLKILALICFCLFLTAFISAGRQDKKRERLAAGSEGAK